MSKFCSKCGGELKQESKFCPACGSSKLRLEAVDLEPAQLEPEPVQPTVVASRPVPPQRRSGCGIGCFVGCLVVVIIFLIIIAVLVGLFWYFFLREREPGSYFEIDNASKEAAVVECTSALCLENNLKTCSPAEGETDIGDFAAAEIKILGKEKGSNSCIVYVKVMELKETPEELDAIPDFILETTMNNLSLECLVPSAEYKQGVEAVGEYVSENMINACKGPLLDFIDKFGIEVED